MRKLTAEFPFIWGAATSSHQVEGYNDKNDWALFEAQGHIEGGVRSGAATDHWNRFREDIRLAADLGLNSYRFSVEWSRIEPEQDRFDPEAMKWYSDLIAECEKHRIMPMLCLHHFTSPQWFAAKGGFTWDQAAERFRIYTRHVVQNLGSRIPLWLTFNEPMVLTVGTYLGQFMPPAVYSPPSVALASHQLLKSHALAYDVIHSEIPNREGPWKDRPIEVGIAQNMIDFNPVRGWHPMEWLLSKVFHGFYNRSWLDGITGKKPGFGVPGLVPNAKPVKEALGRKTCEFIGINYYTKAYTQWRPSLSGGERIGSLPIGLSFSGREEVASDVGWAIHPRGLEKMIQLVGKYGLPIYITENGIADDADAKRPDYILSHLKVVARAIENGADIRGYYYWSLLDNFEWIKGFGPRFGLYRVNYETFERTKTRSAELFRKIIESQPWSEGRTPQSEHLKNF